MRLRAATRASPLARWQADHVAALLRATTPGLGVEVVARTTAPDRDLTAPIDSFGGKGAFAKEIQRAVLDGHADIAVHSAKDLPSTGVDGLVLAAVPPRGDARDVLVGPALVDLPVGATVATGSNRRRVQLADLRPDLDFVALRGNIATRVAVVGTAGVDAVVAAGAALLRMDMTDAIADWLPPHVMTPQVGQGALAVECRADDVETIALVARIEDPASRRTVDAERGFLVALGGDCELPAGAHATLDDPEDAMSALTLRAVLELDGTLRRCVVRGGDPGSLGPAAVSRLETTVGHR